MWCSLLIFLLSQDGVVITTYYVDATSSDWNRLKAGLGSYNIILVQIWRALRLDKNFCSSPVLCVLTYILRNDHGRFLVECGKGA